MARILPPPRSLPQQNIQNCANLLVPVQLPLGLLNAAQGHPMLVELKNGETLNGHLVNCDTWMNLTLKEVVQTSPVRIPLLHLPARSNETLNPSFFAREQPGYFEGSRLLTIVVGRRQVYALTRGLRQGQQCT
ncbi:hypothetical protein LLEC1_05061 [Akanthomyces lecanii]|uniref:LSM complex subunit LSM4 n=1 Tax=Cordyceps confragosa TaxID=2714763 RepID=A0A179IEX3_CORDF|nr:hypothetical protein LLEC1_05061 [Akanthomyces lecanii]